MERARNRRTRLGPGRRSIGERTSSGQHADVCDSTYRERERSQLHGEQGALALPFSRSGGDEQSNGGVRSREMRGAFFRALLGSAEQDESVHLVVGDIGYGVVEEFARKFPGRFLNAGVAEQNMTGLAAGMALSGKIVFTYSIANFPILRCLEQIRNDVCYHNANVKIVAVGGGLAYGALGSTHHATEDLAIMRSLPRMIVVAPGDPVETAAATRALAANPGPCYLRLGRAGEANVHR